MLQVESNAERDQVIVVFEQDNVNVNTGHNKAKHPRRGRGRTKVLYSKLP